MDEREELERAIAVLESQRDVLGDAVAEPLVEAARERLRALQAPAGGRLQQVTVLFAGQSSLLDPGADAEESHERLNRLWQRLDRAITRHGGYIDKHMGDAVMAIWGLEAQEDDAVRALQAAIEMQPDASSNGDAMLRIGINTGMVLLDRLDDRGKLTATGDAVNTARRLQEAAPPGRILVGGDSYALVRERFDLDPLPPLFVKGKDLPIRAYLARAPRAGASPEGGSRGETRPLVGRRAELARFDAMWTAACAHGRGGALTLIGEAGIGKSRLVREILRRAGLNGPAHRARAEPGMRHRAFALVRELFATMIGIRETDDAARVRELLEAHVVATMGPNVPQAAAQTPFIGQLLGYDFGESPELASARGDARQIHERGLLYLCDYFRAACARGAVLYVMDDIHWADEPSLDLLERIGAALGDVPLVLLVAGRPAFCERRPSWGDTFVRHERIDLGPLPVEETLELVKNQLLRIEEIPRELAELVLARAEGNPYYVEELLRVLVDDAVIVPEAPGWRIDIRRLASSRTPASLTGLLQARLDALDPEEREVIGQAAVVGRTFWDSALEHLGGSARTGRELASILQELERRDLIFVLQKSRFAGTRERIFKHALLRDVAYQMVLRRPRGSYHLRTAEWLMREGGTRAAEIAVLVADHLEAAGQRAQAAQHLVRAAQDSAARFANADALAYLDRALELGAARDASERFRLLELRERLLDAVGRRDRQRSDLDALARLGEALDREAGTCRSAHVALRVCNLGLVTGDYDGAARAAGAAIEIAARHQDAALQAQGWLLRGQVLWNQGRYDDAGPPLDRALALSREAARPEIEAQTHRSLGAIHHCRGNNEEARRHVEMALVVFRRLGDARGEGVARNALGGIQCALGDVGQAMASFEQARAMAESIGDRRTASIPMVNLAICLDQVGRYDQARRSLERFLAIKREIGDRPGEVWGLNHLGLVHHHTGNDRLAEQCSREALGVAQSLRDRNTEGTSLTFLGHALSAQGRLPEADHAYQRALAIRRELRQADQELEVLAGLARVALARGQPARALELCEPALQAHDGRWPQGLDEPFRVELTLVTVLAACQDPRARTLLERSRKKLRADAARIRDRELRRSFLENVPYHRALLEERIA